MQALEMPIPSPPKSCNETDNLEFHSLRPYQKSPCNPEPQDLSVICGNTLFLNDPITVPPFGKGSNCIEEGDILKCTYTVNRGFTVEVDSSKSKLPIAGNTENVRNISNYEDEFDDAQKMNEYLS